MHLLSDATRITNPLWDHVQVNFRCIPSTSHNAACFSVKNINFILKSPNTTKVNRYKLCLYTLCICYLLTSERPHHTILMLFRFYGDHCSNIFAVLDTATIKRMVGADSLMQFHARWALIIFERIAIITTVFMTFCTDLNSLKL